MDVTELKIAFNLSETITERIRRFREDRISKIFSNETPVPFYDNAKIVHSEKLKPMVQFGFYSRHNLDGFLTYSRDSEGKSYSYVQLFNNGIIEAVEGRYLGPRENEGNLSIRGIAYEIKLIESSSIYLSALKELNVELPIFIFLTFVGVKGYFMSVGQGEYKHRGEDEIDRDILLLPEVIIENYNTALEDVLKPCFDAMWNACGFPRSPSYDDAGKRIEK
jgi:hypothetical protein